MLMSVHVVWLFSNKDNSEYYLVLRITTYLESINKPPVTIELKRITLVLKILWEVCSPMWKNLRVASPLKWKIACNSMTPMISMNLLNPFLGEGVP